MDKHGGDLRFETEAGKGATFFTRLPIASKRSDEAKAGSNGRG